MDFASYIQILDSTIRLSTPLLLACLAGLFSERAGIFDIGLEGKMLAAAFASAALSYATGNVWVGLLGGIFAALLMSAIMALPPSPFVVISLFLVWLLIFWRRASQSCSDKIGFSWVGARLL